MDLSAIWKNDKSKMLAAINHQVTLSLKTIKTTFQLSGSVAQDHFLRAEFKNDFLSSANSQIEKAYEQFEIFSNVEDQLNSHDTLLSMLGPTNANRQAMNSMVIKRRNSSHQMDDPIELVDSDDEASENRAHLKSETGAIETNAPAVLPLGNLANDEHCSGSAAYNRLLQADGRLKAASMPKGEEENGCLRADLIQLNDSCVETIDGRSGIKAEPTQNSWCETSNKEYSGNLRAIQIDDSDDKEMPNMFAEGNQRCLVAEVGANKAVPCKLSVDVPLNQKNGDYNEDIPLVLVAVGREINISNGSVANSGTNSSRDPEKGTVVEEAISNKNRSHQTSKQKSNASSSQAARKTGVGNKRLAQVGHKVHANEFPFHCSRCFRRFLKENKKNFHEMACEKQRYDCNLCKKVFRDKHDLERHMRTHTGIKPFRCAVCMKKFSQKSHLKLHLKNVHAGSISQKHQAM